MIGPVDSGCFERLGLLAVKIADVDNDLRPRRHLFPDSAHNIDKSLEIEDMHGHEKQRVKIAGFGEAVGACENLVGRHRPRLEISVAFSEAAKLAPATTGINLNPNLPENDSLIAEAPTGYPVGYPTHDGGFDRGGWAIQHRDAIILAGRYAFLGTIEYPQDGLINLHSFSCSGNF
jgi:hypothetical protein